MCVLNTYVTCHLTRKGLISVIPVVVLVVKHSVNMFYLASLASRYLKSCAIVMGDRRCRWELQ